MRIDACESFVYDQMSRNLNVTHRVLLAARDPNDQEYLFTKTLYCLVRVTEPTHG